MQHKFVELDRPIQPECRGHLLGNSALGTLISDQSGDTGMLWNRILIVGLASTATVFSVGIGAASPVVADASGRIVGFYQGPVEPDVVRVISTQGYVTRINMKTGGYSVSPGNAVNSQDQVSTSAVYYASANCSGNAFYTVGQPVGTNLGGWVFWSEADNALWYVPKAPVISQFTALSVRPLDSGPCSNISVFGDYTPARLNDPNVTGISNTPPQAPLRLEVATISTPSGLLFRDGFESTT